MSQGFAMPHTDVKCTSQTRSLFEVPLREVSDSLDSHHSSSEIRIQAQPKLAEQSWAGNERGPVSPIQTPPLPEAPISEEISQTEIPIHMRPVLEGLPWTQSGHAAADDETVLIQVPSAMERIINVKMLDLSEHASSRVSTQEPLVFQAPPSEVDERASVEMPFEAHSVSLPWEVSESDCIEGQIPTRPVGSLPREDDEHVSKGVPTQTSGEGEHVSAEVSTQEPLSFEAPPSEEDEHASAEIPQESQPVPRPWKSDERDCIHGEAQTRPVCGLSPREDSGYVSTEVPTQVSEECEHVSTDVSIQEPLVLAAPTSDVDELTSADILREAQPVPRPWEAGDRDCMEGHIQVRTVCRALPRERGEYVSTEVPIQILEENGHVSAEVSIQESLFVAAPQSEVDEASAETPRESQPVPRPWESGERDCIHRHAQTRPVCGLSPREDSGYLSTEVPTQISEECEHVSTDVSIQEPLVLAAPTSDVDELTSTEIPLEAPPFPRPWEAADYIEGKIQVRERGEFVSTEVPIQISEEYGHVSTEVLIRDRLVLEATPLEGDEHTSAEIPLDAQPVPRPWEAGERDGGEGQTQTRLVFGSLPRGDSENVSTEVPTQTSEECVHASAGLPEEATLFLVPPDHESPPEETHESKSPDINSEDSQASMDMVTVPSATLQNVQTRLLRQVSPFFEIDGIDAKLLHQETSAQRLEHEEDVAIEHDSTVAVETSPLPAHEFPPINRTPAREDTDLSEIFHCDDMLLGETDDGARASSAMEREADFEIVVDTSRHKYLGDSFGLGCDIDCSDDVSLEIVKIKNGVLHKWNVRSEMSTWILPGDRIVACNGVSESSQQIFEECAKRQALKMTIRPLRHESFPCVCKTDSNEVVVHVYDLYENHFTRLWNSMTPRFGAFHTGVEVYGIELCFGANPNDDFDGIYVLQEPRHHPHHKYRRSISIGCTAFTRQEFEALVPRIYICWPGWLYHPFRRNCHTFTDFFCKLMGFPAGPKCGLFATGDASLMR